jgi:hypothetical protein
MIAMINDARLAAGKGPVGEYQGYPLDYARSHHRLP